MNWQRNDLHKFRDHHFESRMVMRRAVIAFMCVIVMLAVVIARFYSLQILQHDNFVTLSDQNRIQVRPVSPNRGLIRDSEGTILALNSPSFTLSVVPERVEDMSATLDVLKSLVEISDYHLKNFDRALKQRRRPHEPAALKFNLTEDEIATIAVNEYRLAGVEVEAQLVRKYPFSELFVHTIGYVGRINERELKRFSPEQYRRYSGTNSIGKIGLERFYESDLLGEPGLEQIETNARGRVLRVLEREDPTPGKDILLFISSKLQAVALEQLKGRRGAIVAIDTQTGGVLAMVSTPVYDPNLFVTGISYKNYNALRDSPEKPQINRAIQAQYPAGSTLKPVLGMAGLEHKVTTFTQTVYDPGYYQIENDKRLYREWKRGGHGKGVNLRKAIVESCDIYFYDLAFNLGVKRMHEYGAAYGLGRRTGLDIPSEKRGNWPSPEWKKARRGRNWYTGDSLNMSIGQGFVLVTPIQLAVMTAKLANRGELITPRFVRSIGDVETEKVVLDKSLVDESIWNYIHDSMKGVMHDAYHGTAWAVGKTAEYNIAGKTGTAQVVGIAQGGEYESEKLSERNRDHALFIGFAPVEAPKIAVAVIIENGESSGLAAGMAKAVMDAYLLKDNSPRNEAELETISEMNGEAKSDKVARQAAGKPVKQWMGMM